MKEVIAGTLLLIVLFYYLPPLTAQPQYWVALNFDLVFHADGTVDVKAKLHPFTVEGRSLYGNEDVEKDMNSSLKAVVYEILMMFTDNPSTIRYDAVSLMGKNDSERVLCDVAGIGKVEEFKGAYVVELRVYLNTSKFVRKLEDSIYEVKVRDSYTSRDPRSWIDVISFTFKDVELKSFRWEPTFAKGPSEKHGNKLLWINYNEQDAPDFYVFILNLSDFVYVGEPPEVNASILGAGFRGDAFVVKVKNSGWTTGYAYVVVKSASGEQARKIYLWNSEVKEVLFSNVAGEKILVEVWSGDKLLDRKTVTRTVTGREEANKTVEAPVKTGEETGKTDRKTLYNFAVAVAVLSLAIIVLAVLLRRKRNIEEKYNIEGLSPGML